MASVEFLQRRVDSKKAEIEKLQRKLERIRKAEASGWEDNPYSYDAYDLKWTIKDLEVAKAALEGYEFKLAEEIEKADSRNVAVILQFLETWKRKCREYYEEGIRRYFVDREELRKLTIQYADASFGTEEYKQAREALVAAEDELRRKTNGYYERVSYENKFGRTCYTSRKVREGEYERYKPYVQCINPETALERLEKDIAEESNRKYDFIINRTNRIVGQITDASNLSISDNGELNGIVIGTIGKAHVKTVGAGGYNIQCFHFRTYIKECKD